MPNPNNGLSRTAARWVVFVAWFLEYLHVVLASLVAGSLPTTAVLIESAVGEWHWTLRVRGKSPDLGWSHSLRWVAGGPVLSVQNTFPT